MHRDTIHIERIVLKDGRRLAYEEYGDPDGKPIFLFHGLPGSRLQKPPCHELFCDMGVRLITADRPGAGYSDPMPGRKLHDWPEDLIQLANALDIERFGLVGVSGGGPYACACAYRYPNRVVATSLVGSLAPVAVPRLWGGMKMRMRLFFRMSCAAPTLLEPLLMGVRERVSKCGLAGPETRLCRCPDRRILSDKVISKVLHEDFVEATRQGVKHIIREGQIAHRWGFDPAGIRGKVFLWHGKKDSIVPSAMGEWLARRIPGCVATFPKDSGHYDVPFLRAGEIVQPIAEAF